MGLNKQKGNMYGFVTHTWNPIKGKCEHDCCYCYMKKWGKELPPLRLDEKEMETDLGKGNFIFVGSSTDMFAKNVNCQWIEKVLKKCAEYDNKYLLQTKNPFRIQYYGIPFNSVIGTTLEGNCVLFETPAPLIQDRVAAMEKIRLPKMVTIEPILIFGLQTFVEMIKRCNPQWVNIGADSTRGRKYSLLEPTWTQVEDLIAELEKFTEVKIKKNLNRLKKT